MDLLPWCQALDISEEQRPPGCSGGSRHSSCSQLYYYLIGLEWDGWHKKVRDLLRPELTSGTMHHYSQADTTPKLQYKPFRLLVNVYLFIWLHWVLVTAYQLLAAACGI